MNKLFQIKSNTKVDRLHELILFWPKKYVDIDYLALKYLLDANILFKFLEFLYKLNRLIREENVNTP